MTSLRPVVLTCLALFAADAWAAPTAEELDAAAKAAIAAASPVVNDGVQVAVVGPDGRLLYSGNFGERDRSDHLPVTPRTLFQIGSTTKAFTSALVSDTAEAKGLPLDKPVNGLLPNYELKLSSPEVMQKVTLVDMLAHRTGLPRHDLIWTVAPYGREEVFSRLPYLGFNESPGWGFRGLFQYNNLMYAAAGIFLERATGKSWEENLQSRILTPLGMTSTRTSTAVLQPDDQMALSYNGETLLPTADLLAVAPAGSITSTAEDMAKWLSLHLMHGKTPDGTAVLSRTALERTYVPEIAVESEYDSLLPAGAPWSYGLGWFVGKSQGQKVIVHAGNTFGFTAMMTLLPESGCGVAVLSNQSGDPVPAKVADALDALLLGNAGATSELRAPPRPRGVRPLDELPAPAAPRLLRPSAEGACAPTSGVYYNRGYGPLEIRDVEGTPTLRYFIAAGPIEHDANGYGLHLQAWGMPFDVALSASGDDCAQLTAALEPTAPPVFLRVAD